MGKCRAYKTYRLLVGNKGIFYRDCIGTVFPYSRVATSKVKIIPTCNRHRRKGLRANCVKNDGANLITNLELRACGGGGFALGLGFRET